CGSVARYLTASDFPPVTVVEGKSSRARSRPLKAGSPPLHSFPSGTNFLSLPLTLGTRRLSNVPNGPPLAARAALQAAVPVAVPPPAAHAALRLIGVVGAPWANAGAPASRGNTPATAAAAARRRIMTVSPRISSGQ